MALKKAPSDNIEIIKITLNEIDQPVAFKAKVDELVKSGMSKKEAKNFVSTTPFELEVYYSPDCGLFLVESEAVESTEIYDPYTGVEMEEADEE